MFFQADKYMTGNYTCNYMHMHRNVYFQAFAFISQGCICNYIIEQGILLCWNLQAHAYTMAFRTGVYLDVCLTNMNLQAILKYKVQKCVYMQTTWHKHWTHWIAAYTYYSMAYMDLCMLDSYINLQATFKHKVLKCIYATIWHYNLDILNLAAAICITGQCEHVSQYIQ